ncbi:MAG: amidohydrolase family protein [Nocardioides sp.]|uniref:amidohydrolase family protein n=1 Tax=Nocardioides sp. TaxID=35761 RepID=UPI0039E5C8D7
MASCDLMIAGGTVLVSASPPVVLEHAAVAVVGAAVADVGPEPEVASRWTTRSVIDATEAVISPGFVDAHVHLAAPGGYGQRGYTRGVTAGPFAGGGKGEGMTPLVGGMVNRPAHHDAVRAVAAVRLAAMLRCGYTGVVDAGGPGAQAVAEAAEWIGIRAAVGPSLADVWHDETGRFGRRMDIESILTRAAVELDWLAEHDVSTLQPIISAAGTQTSSDELLSGVAALAADRGLGVHVPVTYALRP